MKKISLALSLLMVCCCNVHSFVSAQDYLLDKMEPPFWYTGMKCQQLQIMVHGNKAGELEPIFQYSGVETDSIIRVPNLNYLFIYLKISKDARNGSFLISREGGPVTLPTDSAGKDLIRISLKQKLL